jgi:hypothetical protein
MSALSQFVGGGNKIKSIQRGTAFSQTAFFNGSTNVEAINPGSVSISAVNPSKTIVYFTSQPGWATIAVSGTNTSSSRIVSSGFSITLSSSTSVTIVGNLTGNGQIAAALSFEVVEFY